MTFIDWSDSEGMFDLFKEFIQDEMNESSEDRERHEFLSHLLRALSSANEVTIVDAIKKLTAIQDSITGEFSTDPVSQHLTDLINELERIR